MRSALISSMLPHTHRTFMVVAHSVTAKGATRSKPALVWDALDVVTVQTRTEGMPVVIGIRGPGAGREDRILSHADKEFCHVLAGLVPVDTDFATEDEMRTVECRVLANVCEDMDLAREVSAFLLCFYMTPHQLDDILRALRDRPEDTHPRRPARPPVPPRLTAVRPDLQNLQPTTE